MNANFKKKVVQTTDTNVSFDDGMKRVTINMDPNRVISWNPNDVGFVDRFLAFMDWVENDFKRKVSELGINASDFADFSDGDDSEEKVDKKSDALGSYSRGGITELGKEVEEAIDNCFNSPVSKAAFNGVNPFSPCSNGNLLFINFFNSLMPVIQNSIKEFDKARKKYKDAAKKATNLVAAPPSGRNKS